MPSVLPFPWAMLPKTTREALRAERIVRTAARALARPLATALSALLGRPALVSITRVGEAEAGRGRSGARLELSPGGVRASVALAADRQLVCVCLARLLEKEVQLFGDAELDEDLAGAWAALVLELCRASSNVPVHLGRALGSGEPLLPTIEVEASVLLDDLSYGISAEVTLGNEVQPLVRPKRLESLGEIPLEVPIVVALTTLSGAELRALEPGDALLPDAGFSRRGSRTDGAGVSAILAPRGSGFGLRVTWKENGDLLVCGPQVAMPLDGEMSSDAQKQAEPKEAKVSVTETVFEAPVLVRVELGRVRLTAREWAELQVGDVIPLGKHVSEPALLSIAGIDVARGELVNVEGELGVRISELSRKVGL